MVVASVVLVAGAVIGVRMVQDARAVGPAQSGVHDIDVSLSGFSPDAVQVAKGATITWHFDDDIEHDVVSDMFRSERLTHGTFTHTFTAPGTYEYVCSLHPGVMRGRVIVTAP